MNRNKRLSPEQQMQIIKSFIEGKDIVVHLEAGFSSILNKNTHRSYEFDFLNAYYELKVELPKYFDEIKVLEGYYLDNYADAKPTDYDFERAGPNGIKAWRNVWPTERLAEASRALSMLLLLRDKYNNGWIPDWGSSTQAKYCITGKDGNNVYKVLLYRCEKVLAFKSPELRDAFYDNFQELLKEAEPLLHG